jgi:hypothetical protein
VAIEWFYESNGSRLGPVQPNELKALADAGKITPETRVWREGMQQWVAAKAIRGLFQAAPTQAPAMAAAPVAPAPRSSPSTRSDPFAVHPLDRLLTAAKSYLPDGATALLSRIASRLGLIAIYAAVVLVPLTGIAFGIRQNKLSPIYVAFGVATALLVLQYVAHRLLATLDTAISTNKTVLSSLAVPDCFVVLAATGAVALGIYTLFGPSAEGEVTEAVYALCIWGAGFFLCAVALQPESLGVVVRPECCAAEEAVGVVTFLMKVFLRAVPIAFATTVLLGVLKTLGLIFTILTASELDVGIIFRATQTSTLLLGGAAVPISAYLATLAYYLTLDVISAIVSLPGKLDVLAEVRRNGEE